MDQGQEPSFQMQQNNALSAPRHRALVASISGGIVLLLLAGGAYWAYQEFFAPNYDAMTEAFNANDFATARALADAQLKTNPKDVDALILKSLILSQEGSLSFRETELGTQAVAVAIAATTEDPNRSEAWRALGYAYEIQREYEKAHESYQKALAIDSKNILAIFSDAHIYDLEGKMDEAEAGYRKALVLNPAFAKAHAGLGRVYVLQNKPAEAIAEFTKAYDQEQNVHARAEAAYSLGMLELAQNDLASAYKHLQSATDLNPKYPLGWYGLGTAEFTDAVSTSTAHTTQERLDLISASFTALGRAIELNPYQMVAQVQMARQMFLWGDTETARKILDAAPALVPYDISLNPEQQKELIRQIEDLQRYFATST